jgi:hypothetical protein
MVRAGLALLLVAIIAAAAVAVAGNPLRRTRHSGTITAVDAVGHTHALALQEVGPWAPDRDATTTLTFVLDRNTRLELVSRSVAHGLFVEHPLTPSEIHRGDYATVTVERRGRTPRAVVVEVVRP